MFMLITLSLDQESCQKQRGWSQFCDGFRFGSTSWRLEPFSDSGSSSTRSTSSPLSQVISTLFSWKQCASDYGGHMVTACIDSDFLASINCHLKGDVWVEQKVKWGRGGSSKSWCHLIKWQKIKDTCNYLLLCSLDFGAPRWSDLGVFSRDPVFPRSRVIFRDVFPGKNDRDPGISRFHYMPK